MLALVLVLVLLLVLVVVLFALVVVFLAFGAWLEAVVLVDEAVFVLAAVELEPAVTPFTP